MSAQIGVTERMAGERRSASRWCELSDETRTFGAHGRGRQALREQHGADVLVMGCAGMARYRDRLQRDVGVPVVEPTQAAVSMAIGRSRLGWSA